MKIFYGVAGEGLGHATRAHAMIEELGSEHEYYIYTFGEAHNYFSRLMSQDWHWHPKFLYQIYGLRFGRTNGSKISLLGTMRNYRRYRRERKDLDAHQIYWNMLSVRPDVVITDFEPATAAASRMIKLNRPPLVSVDNQHKFSHFGTDGLPFGLRAYCNVAGWFTKKHVGKTDGCVVSTFYHDFERTGGSITKTNVFIRKEVRDLEPTNEGHVLVYWKPSVGPEMLYNLRKCPFPVKVFGTSEPPKGPTSYYENFSFHPLDYENFAQALAGCRALFCTAGNQLLGEACYFNKPTFTVPEPKQHEQSVNAFYAEKMGFAKTAVVGKYNRETVVDFLHNFKAAEQKRVNGVTSAADVIRSFANKG